MKYASLHVESQIKILKKICHDQKRVGSIICQGTCITRKVMATLT